MLAEKEALLVARLEEFGRSELLTPEFGLHADQERGARQHAFPFEPRLAARQRAGEMGVFDQLVEKNQALVCGRAVRILNDAEAAGDATQETFLKFYRHFGNFRGEASLKTWI